MINKLQSNKLGANTTSKVTPDKVNEIIDAINGGITQIGKLIGANLNSTADQVIKLNKGNTFIVTDVIITNISKTLTTAATVQINEGLGKTGTQVWILNGPTVRTITSKTGFMGNSVGGASTVIPTYPTAAGSTVSNTIYYSNGVAEGSAATCDIYVYGYTLK